MSTALSRAIALRSVTGSRAIWPPQAWKPAGGVRPPALAPLGETSREKRANKMMLDLPPRDDAAEGADASGAAADAVAHPPPSASSVGPPVFVP